MWLIFFKSVYNQINWLVKKSSNLWGGDPLHTYTSWKEPSTIVAALWGHNTPFNMMFTCIVTHNATIWTYTMHLGAGSGLIIRAIIMHGRLPCWFWARYAKLECFHARILRINGSIGVRPTLMTHASFRYLMNYGSWI